MLGSLVDGFLFGFSYAMIVGVLVGTYSSVAIATPLVLQPRLLKWIIYVLVAGVLLGLAQALPQVELREPVQGVVERDDTDFPGRDAVGGLGERDAAAFALGT